MRGEHFGSVVFEERGLVVEDAVPVPQVCIPNQFRPGVLFWVKRLSTLVEQLGLLLIGSRGRGGAAGMSRRTWALLSLAVVPDDSEGLLLLAPELLTNLSHFHSFRVY